MSEQKYLEQFNAEVEQHYRWNYWISIIDGAWFSLGMGFVSLYTILTLFVVNLTTSKTLISSVTTLTMLGSYLPQILIANHTERVRWKKPLTAYFGFFQRVPWLALCIFIYLFADRGTNVLLTGFFILYGIYCVASGFVTPPWFDLTAKTIPPDRLGRYFGYRSFACGITEFIGAAIAGIVLKAIAFPYNFAILFALTFLATGISFGFFINIKEPDYPVTKPRIPLKDYLSSLPQILKEHRNFRMYILALIFIQFFVMANALYTASAIDSLKLDSVAAGLQVGIFTALMLAFQTISFPIWGNLSDHIGHRVIIVFSGVLNIAAALVAAFGTHLFLYYLVFIFAGISQGASRISVMAIIPEFCSPEKRPTYISLMNSISGFSVVFASFIGGVIADIFNYRVTFLLTALLIFLGIAILVKGVQDPRKNNASIAT